MTPNPLLGTALHTIGAASAALCYSPQRFVHKWAWQTYWLVQAAFCWLILPWVFAYFCIPNLGEVLAAAPRDAMIKSYLFGALYGIGGIAFGVSIRYIGFSLTYAIAIGVSCVGGTFIGPFLAGNLSGIVSQNGFTYVLVGVLIGAVAMLFTGLAGFQKEKELGAGDYQVSDFNPRVGIPICLLAGVLSAVYSLAIGAGDPITQLALTHGAGDFAFTANYLFSNPGAFTTTLFYAGWLSLKNKTSGEFFGTADGTGLIKNYLLAALTGLLWYLQFFFYGLGHDRMGTLGFSSWAIHMIILILLSCGFGVAIGEWKKCRVSTKRLITFAVALLVIAVGFITHGNKIATDTAPTPPATSSGH
ncbi:rhamnose:proton symporter [Nibricoccus aquaticus]|uniref:Rhamnose:proton symporter n=1 Tax=Nibricoccus aquaticus TaxID=2576891 RepID=A0A290Q4L5_9BACT|nr:L-rhamnose/proton symporter RhaT [Nibricoccus aquaticus]ATC63343.1 rhamnose:proton symporter [Nibricoccus aquaticus]